MNDYRPIVNIDLHQDISPIDFADAPNGIYLILWWQNVPLAHKVIEPISNRLSPSDIAQLFLPAVNEVMEAYAAKHGSDYEFANFRFLDNDPVQQIKQIASTLESNAEPTGVLPTVSVVIPTINRPQMLATCLRSL
ncbi:MAG: hypothetical protein AAGD96_09260, partial [Chloroflexota bacterium]